jgi:DNA-binding transcriptional MerR regulator
LPGEEIKDKLDNIEIKQTEMLKKLEDVGVSLNEIKSAFPDEDFSGHARYHQALIERNVELRRLRVAIVEKSLSALVWLLIIWLGSALWREVVEHLPFVKK